MIVRDHVVDHEHQSPRPYDHIDHIIIHRIGKRIGTSGREISKKFMHEPRVGKYTGHKIPYHFVVTQSGMVDQCLEIEETGVHAGGFNHRSIGVACVGDFRKHKPTTDQWFALREIVSALYTWAGPSCQVKGHTELGWKATKDVKKQCPGALLDLDALWLDVYDRSPKGLNDLDREMHIRVMGVVL